MPDPAARTEPTATTEKHAAPGRAQGPEKADQPDRYGEWLADDARIWRVYGQAAKEDDKERVKRWNSALNNLALFATLFSGITTAFIIESRKDLKPDFGELTYRVQNATAHGRAYVEEPFVVPGQARLVNCLWITSLLLSLSAALIAIMGQDWIELYVDRPVCNMRQWAEIRSFRFNGVHRWYMPGVIATAPVLLHASLLLFGTGLAVFMSSDVITRHLCIALCVITAFLYAVTMLSPILWPSSPFRSPATMLLRRWFCAIFRRNTSALDCPEPVSLRADPGRLQKFFSLCSTRIRRLLHQYGPDVTNGWTDILETPSPALVAHSLSWLSSASSAPEVAQLVILGLCDHVTGLKVCEHTNSQSLTQKICQDLTANWERLSLLDLSRYVFICGNAGQRFSRASVKMRFEEAIATETAFSQDFLLALIHLTNGFRGEPSWESFLEVGFVPNNQLIVQPSQLERLCARILVCAPITLSTVASIVHSVKWDTGAISYPPMPGNLIVLMDRWRHLLPPDLIPIERMLHGMLSVKATKQKYTLTTLCSNTVNDRGPRPIDGIIHSLVALFLSQEGCGITDRLILNLILSVADAASTSDGSPPRPHTCLAAIFGNSDPEITKSAWNGRLEHAIDPVLLCIDACERPPSSHVPLACHKDLQPMLARMLVRDICPPFPPPSGTIGRTRPPRGDLLFQLVAFMTLDGAAPDDMFRPVLDQRALIGLLDSIDKISSPSCRYEHITQFWRILTAIAWWIATRRDSNSQAELFQLFTLSQTDRGVGWDLVDAVGIAIRPMLSPTEPERHEDDESLLTSSRAMFSAARRFMAGLERLRAVFPESPLWDALARKIGQSKARFPASDWPIWSEAALAATGLDPTQFSPDEPSRGTGTASDTGRGAVSDMDDGSTELASIAQGSGTRIPRSSESCHDEGILGRAK